MLLILVAKRREVPMIAWIIIIITLTVFQVFAFYFSFPELYIYLSTVLMLVAALGMLYRVVTRRRPLWKPTYSLLSAGFSEKIEKEIEKVRERK